MASLAACRSTAGFGSVSCVAAEAADPAIPAEATVGGGADISVGCFGKREGEKTACEIRMEPPPNSSKDVAPPQKFFEGLEKYFDNKLADAKELLNGDDLLSKSLLVLVDVKMSDGSNNKEIQERIDSMDFKGNDIALMFCVLAQEYGMKMAQAHNLLLKRFGKPQKVIVSQEEFDENEANTQAKESEEIPELEPAEVKKVEPEAKPAVTPEVKQVGGKRITRKASSSLPKKKKRVSRGKA